MSEIVYILRHGETDWNASGRLQGQTDVPLNDKGRNQARAAASFIATLDFEVCYASDLARAFETAQLALMHHPTVKNPLPSPDLRERNFGSMNGHTHAEIEQHKKKNPDFYIDQDGAGRLFPKDGEPNDVFVGRVRTAFETIVARHTRALIVGHGGFTRELVRSFSPHTEIFQPGNGHVYKMTPYHQHWHIEQVYPA